LILLPKVIFMLSVFLLQNDRLKKQKILRLNGSSKDVDRIKLHLLFGNYAILKHEDTQDKHHEIANLLKTTMTEFTQPVCPFKVFYYDLLPEVDTERTNEQTEKFLIDLIVNKIGFKDETGQRMGVNVDTLIFVAEVFKIVGENEASTTIMMSTVGLLTSHTVFKP